VESDRDLTFEIEMILTAMITVPCSRRGALPSAASGVRAASVRWQYVTSRRQRGANIEERGKRFVFDVCAARRSPGCRVRIRGDRKERLTRILDQALRKNRIVVNNAAVVIFSGTSTASAMSTTPGAADTSVRSSVLICPCAIVLTPNAACTEFAGRGMSSQYNARPLT